MIFGKKPMVRVVTDVSILDLVRAILAEHDLEARQLTLDLSDLTQRFSTVAKPDTQNHEELVLAAALVELFAARRNEVAPDWTAQIGGLDKPRYLLGDPTRYPRFYARCVRESPEPLKRRNLIAPNDYLSFA